MEQRLSDPDDAPFVRLEILTGALREYPWDIPQRDELVRKIDLLGRRRRYAPGDPEYATPLQQDMLAEREEQKRLAERERKVREDRKAGRLVARA